MKNLEKYLIDFDTLKVGDKVWSIEFGDNVVGSITSSGDYPIKIYNTAYARDGKISTFNKFPSLFKSNPFGSISEYPKVMETKIQYEIWELDKNHGLKPKENYSGYSRNTKDRVVLLEPNISQIHNTFEECVKEIQENGNSYIEYTILPRIYKTH